MKWLVIRSASTNAGAQWMNRPVLAEGRGEGGGEQRLFFGGDGAEIEEEAIVLDAGDDGSAALGFAQALFELGGGMAGACNRDEVSGQFLIGSGAAADDREARQNLERGVAGKCGAQMCGKEDGAPVDFIGGHADDAQRGNFVVGAAAVGAQRYFERGDGEFVHAQGAEERIAADALDELALAGNDAGLRAAEQFIAAEGDDRGAGIATGSRDGLGDAAGREIGEAAGAEVFVHGKAVAAGERDELFERGALGEAGDAEIRGVDAKQQARAVIDRALVVAGAGAVGGAHLAQDGAAFGHDVGDAEAVADFDELAAGDDYFGGFGESIEDEEDGGGVVIDDDGGFGADDFGEEARGVLVAFAALPAPEIVFEIGVVRRGFGDLRGGFGREGCAAEIRVQDYAGGVDDAPERGGEKRFDMGDDARFDGGQIRGAGIAGAGLQIRAQIGEDGAGSVGDDGVAGRFGQVQQARLAEQEIDGGELAQPGAWVFCQAGGGIG